MTGNHGGIAPTPKNNDKCVTDVVFVGVGPRAYPVFPGPRAYPVFPGPCAYPVFPGPCAYPVFPGPRDHETFKAPLVMVFKENRFR